tara:strand:- start:174 stop:860 length:687 start_codon:yes stop_codon:yes gene_type:complete
MNEIRIKEHYNSPYLFLPDSIRWIIKQRNEIDITDLDKLEGLNCSIILSLTSIIESFNKELMNNWIIGYFKIYQQTYDIDFLLERLTDELKIEIELSEWNKQKKLFQKITNDELSNIIPNDLMKSMDALFSFRNILTHGNKLSLIETKFNGKTDLRLEPVKFNTLFNFLREKKLIENLTNTKENIFNDMFSNKTITFFIEIVNEYLEKAKISFGLNEELNKELYNLKI